MTSTAGEVTSTRVSRQDRPGRSPSCPAPSPGTAQPTAADAVVRRRAPRARCSSRATPRSTRPGPRCRSCCTSSTPSARGRTGARRRRRSWSSLAELRDAPRRRLAHRLPAARARARQPLHHGERPAPTAAPSPTSSRSSRARTRRHRGRRRRVLLQAVFARIEPLASSRLVIANEFRPDLPEELWRGRRADPPDRAGR